MGLCRSILVPIEFVCASPGDSDGREGMNYPNTFAVIGENFGQAFVAVQRLVHTGRRVTLAGDFRALSPMIYTPPPFS
jgi:hypothetical protein